MVEISKYTNNPIIIAGGAGNWKHLLEGLQSKKINAVATANLLNFIGNGLENARKEILKEFDLPVW
jgi:cyclase